MRTNAASAGRVIRLVTAERKTGMSLAVTPRSVGNQSFTQTSLHLGKTLKYARQQARLTLREVEKKTGYGFPDISKWENGHRTPSLQQVQDLERLYAARGWRKNVSLMRLAEAAQRESRTAVLGGVRPAQMPCPPRILRGRESLLRAMTQATPDDARVGNDAEGVLVLEGGPGAGKTALAAAWVREQNPAVRWPHGVLQADLRGYHPAAAPRAGTEVIAQFLSDLGVSNPPREMDKAARLLHTILAERRMLLILDDAATTEQLRPVLATAGPRCTTVITTRRRMPGLAIRGGATRITVPALTEDDAVRVLIDAARWRDDSAPLLAVARACDYSPLALQAAAIVLAEHHRDTPLLLDKLTGPDRLAVLNSAADDDPASAVRVAWAASLRRLPSEGQRLLRKLAHAGGDDDVIADETVPGLIHGSEGDGGLPALLREHCITSDSTGLRMPSLLRHYLVDETAPLGHGSRAQ